jgi:predicted tellurium resistance membrane protein TerC
VASVELLADPQAWASFLTLSLLEIVLGIDNIIFLAILVDRLPAGERKRARLLGLCFAMLTRLALLFSLIWLSNLRLILASAFGIDISARDVVLLAGGLFLVVQSVLEILEMKRGGEVRRRDGAMSSFWMIIVQVGLIDIVFSLDTVFTAIGLANRIEVMVAAIVLSLPVMIGLAGVVGRFIERYPTVKVLALAILVLVGAELVAEALHFEVPRGYLYCAMAFAAVVEGINIRLRPRG